LYNFVVVAVVPYDEFTFGILVVARLNSSAGCHNNGCCRSDHNDHHRSCHDRSGPRCSPRTAIAVWPHGGCSVGFWPLALKIQKKRKKKCMKIKVRRSLKSFVFPTMCGNTGSLIDRFRKKKHRLNPQKISPKFLFLKLKALCQIRMSQSPTQYT
jgi:hypothetical protein